MYVCIKVSAFNEEAAATEAWSDAATTTARTFQLPSAIELFNSTFDSLTVSWTSPADNSVRQHRLEYGQVGLDDSTTRGKVDCSTEGLDKTDL